MNLQAALPLKSNAQSDFSHWIGNESVLNALINYTGLPQFTYLFGHQHCGKSHLLKALQLLLQAQGVSQMLLQSTSLSATDVVAILPADIKYILIDDICQLAGNEEGEVALFNFFNYCKNQQIKLIVSSSLAVKSELWQLPDLVSRLSSGFTLKLDVLKGALAFECLTQQFAMNGIPVDSAVIQYLQTHYSGAYPKLFQLFLELASETLQQKRKVTVPLVKAVVAKKQLTDSLN